MNPWWTHDCLDPIRVLIFYTNNPSWQYCTHGGSHYNFSTIITNFFLLSSYLGKFQFVILIYKQLSLAVSFLGFVIIKCETFFLMVLMVSHDLLHTSPLQSLLLLIASIHSFMPGHFLFDFNSRKSLKYYSIPSISSISFFVQGTLTTEKKERKQDDLEVLSFSSLGKNLNKVQYQLLPESQVYW